MDKITIRQNTTFVGNLAGGVVKLPKWALYGYDKSAQVYYWVNDVRTCAYTTFRVYTYDVQRDMSGSFIGRASSGIGILFARFADNLPLENIQAPEYPRFSHVDDCGPRDRKPQQFMGRGRPERYGETGEKSVTDGVIIGQHKYNRYGWGKLRQNIDWRSVHK